MTGRETVTRHAPADMIETDPARLRWGIVSTVKAPLADIARFAAWHLEGGATRLTLYLDAPDPESQAFLSAHPRIDVIACDNQYWADKPEKARQTHQLRQAFNATRCYRHSHDLHWLAHLDVDEFLISPTPMALLLAAAPQDSAYLRLAPVEMLSGDADGPRFFKRTAKHAGQPKSVLSELYPVFGPHLPQGFLSYSGGKNITRCGIEGLRIGIHDARINGVPLGNGTPCPAVIGHAHASDFARFKAHMDYRLSHGSYRDLPNGNRALNGILQLLTLEGPGALEAFYEEICTARADLLAGLRRHGMLVAEEMPLDALVARHFGQQPGGDSA